MHLISLITLFALTLGTYLSPVASSVVGDEITGYGPMEQGSGWLLTSARLYLTRDEGRIWQEVTPVLEASLALAADFVPAGYGWLVAGRPGAGDRSLLSLARTSDFGRNWHSEPLFLFAADDPDPTIGEIELDFISSSEGVLRVRHVSSSNFERWSEWRTVDGGETWMRTRRAAATSRPDAVGALGSAAARGSFANPNDGWQIERTGRCAETGAARICEQVTELRATSDGGRTWRNMPLPKEVGGSRRWTVDEGGRGAAAIAGASRTSIARGQGFDKCEVATLDQLRDWRAASPYSAVNLYIGGAKRFCKNLALNANYLRAIYEMGWTFIPTWVGPQSPCYSETSAISRDPAAAWSQGWAEASAAADRLTQLGLTDEEGAGSIVYYDMEHYNTADASCNTAVQSFSAGWKQGLHTRGNLAGVYSTGSVLRLLTTPDHSPDAIWTANWVYSSHNPDATVWDVARLGNDVWSDHQRLRQYTGGHLETWGSTQLNIDSNVLDGPVALMGPAPNTPTPTATPTSTPTATATSTRTVVPMTPKAWFYLPLFFQE